MSASEKYCCPVCGEYIHTKSFYRHLKRAHKYSEEQCDELKRNWPLRTSSSVKCPLCHDEFLNHCTLAEHCSEHHSEDGANGRPQDYSVFSREFSNEEDYKQWLSQECMDKCTTFYQRSKEHKKSGTVLLLRCNRAGRIKNTAKIRVRTTRKDNAYCSCFLTVEYRNDSTVAVKGCFGHAGHELDPALLRLSPEQHEYLKMLLEEHTINYVIQRVRKEHPGGASRLFFVTRDDLWNLIKKYKIRPGFRDDVDITSLSMRVNEKNPDDGIRLFNPPDDPSGKNFVMVIVTPLQMKWLLAHSSEGVSMDDTHHTTRYHVKLATLMVADGKGRGLPAGFLLCNAMNAENVSKFFQVIKQLMPGFHPRRMVTDEALCFWKGYRNVFSNTSTEIRFCRTHILNTWERKTKEVVDVALRPKVNKALRDLLKEPRLDAFQQRFAEIIAFLKAEGQTGMMDYLTKNYLGRTPSWASFASQGAIMDTTNISERWHRTIKDEILHRNSNCRVDCLVELLIRAVEEKCNSIEIMDRRRLVKCSYRSSESIKSHRKAVEFYANRAEKIRSTGENLWQVESSKPEESFIVSWEAKCSCNLVSNTHCLLCGVCPYAWHCSCLDNKSGISCVHRHAVKMYGEGITAASTEPAEQPLEESTLGKDVIEDATLSVGDHDASMGVQYRREKRYQKLNEIMNAYATVEVEARALARIDANESLEKLEKILGHIKLAASVAPEMTTSELPPRPELMKVGAKPHMQKVLLLPRGKLKKPKDSTGEDLHEEIRKMRQQSQEDAL